MGWLQFTSSVIHALAWPAAVAALVITLRHPLGRLLGGVRTLRYKEFQADLAPLEVLAEEAKLPDVTGGEAASPIPLHAREEPRAAVIEAWLLVETEMRRLAQSFGLDRSVTSLVANGLITRDVGAIIRNLRVLRDRAVHEPNFRISQDEAERYWELAQRTSEALRQAGYGDYGSPPSYSSPPSYGSPPSYSLYGSPPGDAPSS